MKGDNDTVWDEEVDVAIVGTGFAGMSAALELAKTKSSFIILEKMSASGGTAVMDAGELSVVGSPQQSMRYIKDSAQLFAQDMMISGEFQNSPEITKYVAEQSHGIYKWLTEELGVKWTSGLGQAGGQSVPRTIATKTGSGLEIHNAMNAKLLEMGIAPRQNCFVQNLIRSEKGNIEGITVREGYIYPSPSSGKLKRIKVRQGLILAHGGITADAFYRSSKYSAFAQSTDYPNSPSSPGGLWEECSKIGCYLMYSNWIRDSWNNPLEKGRGKDWKFSEYAAASYGLWVNSAGHRFVNEGANMKIRSDAIFKEYLQNFKVFSLTNQQGVEALEELRPNYLEDALASGLVRKYLYLDELETSEGFPKEALKKEIESFNKLVKTHIVDHFGRNLRHLKPLKDGPWFIATMTPKFHRYMGGLVVDVSGRVLDAKTQKPIKGLYAAGECTSSIHGVCRLGSCATLDSLVMGRTAGRNVSNEKIMT